MRKTSKLVALLLMAVLLLGAVSPAFAAEAPTEYMPILRIRGEQPISWESPDGPVHLYDDGEYVSGIVNDALPYAFLGLATGNWDKWCEKAWNALKPAYEHFKPDAEGNVPADTHVDYRFDPAALTRNGSYSVGGSYEALTDMRLAPSDEADYIHAMIESIKAQTGHDKVILVGQCAGNAYMLAYLQKYEAPDNYSGVGGVFFSTSTAKGLPNDDHLFSGTVVFDKEIAYKTLAGSDISEGVAEMAGGELLQLIHDTLELVYQSRGLGKVTVSAVQNVYDKVKDGFIAKILKEYYGRCGGYVSAVNENYETYKDYVFPTQADKDEYAVQIAKFDDYYYNVESRQEEIIAEMQSAGVPVSCLVEYGLPSGFPIGGEYSLETCDSRVPASLASFGATVSRFDEKLSDEYIAGREAAGYGKYISPDRQIDASTGLLRDTTWYVRNAAHVFDNQVSALASEVVRHPGATVEDLEPLGYTRFMNYTDADTPLVPAQETNPNDAQPAEPESKNSFFAFFRWLKQLFALIKQLLRKD